MVFAGHDLIAENGALLGESQLFTHGLTTADIDLERLVQERRRMNTWQDRRDSAVVRVPFRYREETLQNFQPRRKFSPAPFVPRDQEGLTSRCQLILTMQAQGLATRLSHIGCKSAVDRPVRGLGLHPGSAGDGAGLRPFASGPEGIYAVSMPCFGTTGRTKSNAQKIAEELGGGFPGGVHREGGAPALRGHRPGHGLPGRGLREFPGPERTQVVMDLANRVGGIAIGTGDLSELALGWATYNGDHMSMYGVNASVPKTLVRYLVRYEAEHSGERLAQALFDVLDTPVSPELLPPKDGEISQKTEELVGPYELHDFFLYYMLRFGFAPGKIYRMACRAFEGRLRPGDHQALARHVLPAVLLPAVQAQLPARRAQGGLGDPLSPGRPADAKRCVISAVVRRDREVISRFQFSDKPQASREMQVRSCG